MQTNPLQLGSAITMLPIVHGSAQSALLVRRRMLEGSFDALAVPLPVSFAEPVCEAVERLPVPAMVLQEAGLRWGGDWSAPDLSQLGIELGSGGAAGGDDDSLEDDEDVAWSYVPIDPCQGVIAAIRSALGEHLPIHWIDMESPQYQPMVAALPDPYALRCVAPERFAAAILPTLQRPTGQLNQLRMLHMGWQLRRLEQRHRRILFVCSVQEWPWIREAYGALASEHSVASDVWLSQHQLFDPRVYGVHRQSLVFLFGELPYLTGLYERARRQLDEDEHLSIDGVKELLIASRTAYQRDLGQRARRITPLLLSQCLKYVRNLTLFDRRLTPDLYTLAVAAQQIIGDQYTAHLVETAKRYPHADSIWDEEVRMGIEQARLPDGQVVGLANRLPGAPLQWRSLRLRPRPQLPQRQSWRMQWNPHQQCSWPPEDQSIESFRSRVFQRAQAVIGLDLARSEKFSTSFKDGIDIRETLRHWYDQDIYVKVMPPNRGTLDACVMLFDSPADPRDYPWRTTWFAEHAEESTLAFYASDFRQQMVGPGIGLASYGGAMFLYPPRPVPDIWLDPRLDFTDSLEERLLAAACLHGGSRQVVLLSGLPPGAGWRRLASRFGKRLVHLPISQFNQELICRLRMVHVLNGQHIRSFAAHFIRRP